MDNNDEWNNIEVPTNNQVEFELEEEVEAAPEEPVVEEKAEVEEQPQVEEPVVEEKPKELEGIETKCAEKRIRQLVRQRKEREEQIQELIKQNELLKQNLETKSKDLTNVTNTTLTKGEEHLEKNIELARQAYLEAFDSGDKEKALNAQEALADAKAELKNIQNWKGRLARQQEVEQQQVVQQPEPTSQYAPQVDTKAQEWAERNDWFGQDTVKTAAALALDGELKNEGYDPNDDEFYEEIDRRMQKSFGQTSDRVQDNTPEPAQVVSGSSRSSPNSGKKVKLSKEDVRLATKWGIPLEQYAAEKLKVTKADGEYTDII